jgi:hypothetical protein
LQPTTPGQQKLRLKSCYYDQKQAYAYVEKDSNAVFVDVTNVGYVDGVPSIFQRKTLLYSCASLSWQ